MNFKNNWINAHSHSRACSQRHFISQNDWNRFLSPNQHASVRYVYNAKKILTAVRTVITDQVRRSKFERAELDDIIIKSILRAQQYSLKKRVTPRLSLYELKPYGLRNYLKPRGTITRIRNRCIMTARSSIVGCTGLSRICFRRRAGTGKIPGVFKI